MTRLSLAAFALLILAACGTTGGGMATADYSNSCFRSPVDIPASCKANADNYVDKASMIRKPDSEDKIIAVAAGAVAAWYKSAYLDDETALLVSSKLAQSAVEACRAADLSSADAGTRLRCSSVTGLQLVLAAEFNSSEMNGALDPMTIDHSLADAATVERLAGGVAEFQRSVVAPAPAVAAEMRATFPGQQGENIVDWMEDGVLRRTCEIADWTDSVLVTQSIYQSVSARPVSDARAATLQALQDLDAANLTLVAAASTTLDTGGSDFATSCRMLRASGAVS